MAKHKWTKRTAPRTGRKKGSRNRVKLPQLSAPEVEQYIDAILPRALERLNELVESEDESISLRASIAILNKRVADLQRVEQTQPMSREPVVIQFIEGPGHEN